MNSKQKKQHRVKQDASNQLHCTAHQAPRLDPEKFAYWSLWAVKIAGGIAYIAVTLRPFFHH